MSYIKSDKRPEVSGVWSKSDSVDPKMSLPILIGLKQSNLDNGRHLLIHVSHHDSPNCGKYYTADDVNKILAPASETMEIVREWVGASSISRERVAQSTNKTAVPEKLYHLPGHVRDHVDYITPGIRLVLGPEENKKRDSAKERPPSSPGRAVYKAKST
ncbi:Pro-kumamolisin, activation domain-containing protein [Hypoxylon sp. FL0890]|nr:Pro-kumamolisin, activation domain-containing protein [Hypoxylon sp. FL0890]